MEIGTSAQPRCSTSKRKKTYVCGSGPKTVKSRRIQWVEEDMTMDPPYTTNNCTEEEIGKYFST